MKSLIENTTFSNFRGSAPNLAKKWWNPSIFVKFRGSVGGSFHCSGSFLCNLAKRTHDETTCEFIFARELPCLINMPSLELTIYQPKVPTLEFVLAQVVSCNWHVLSYWWVTFLPSISNLSTKALSIQEYYTPYACLCMTLHPVMVSTRYSVCKILHTLCLVYPLNILSRANTIDYGRWSHGWTQST